jgi:hypothetical protein
LVTVPPPLALAGALAAVLGCFPALRLGARARFAVLLPAAAIVAFAPLAVPIERPIVRFQAAIFAGVALMKLWDLHLGALRGVRPRFGEYLKFLADLPRLVDRAPVPARPGRAESAARLALGLLGMAAAALAFWFALGVDWSAWPFLAEHAVKAALLFPLGVAYLAALAALSRLLGGGAVDPGGLDSLAAPTPAEFWRRYNRNVGQFLREDCFLPLGGRRHPARATLAAFAISGLLHEYLFAVAAGRVTGQQLLFFLVAGSGAAATLRLRPHGAPAALGAAATLAFHLAASLLFFASAHGVFPIYQRAPPAWLRLF